MPVVVDLLERDDVIAVAREPVIWAANVEGETQRSRFGVVGPGTAITWYMRIGTRRSCERTSGCEQRTAQSPGSAMQMSVSPPPFRRS